MLWELFSFNPPTLQLYVRLVRYSPYLSGILTSNPGMIDELMDSLVLDKLPTLRDAGSDAGRTCAAARKTSSRSCTVSRTMQLRVGVRDILGKEDMQATHRALSDIAEVCLDRSRGASTSGWSTIRRAAIGGEATGERTEGGRAN